MTLHTHDNREKSATFTLIVPILPIFAGFVTTCKKMVGAWAAGRAANAATPACRATYLHVTPPSPWLTSTRGNNPDLIIILKLSYN